MVTARSAISSKPVRSYAFKAGNNPLMLEGLKNLLELTADGVSLLLEDLWTETWIDDVGTSSLKAYKVINENRVKLTALDDHGVEYPVYLPSRIRRGIAEAAGRILRSQHERKKCFEDVREILLLTGLSGNLDTLVRTVART